MKIRLISKTVGAGEYEGLTAEQIIVHNARVSNEHNQEVAEIINSGHKLLGYCIRKKHWSVFDQADMTLEIITARDITAQIRTHKSFCFQEFSQRYSAVKQFEPITLRKQAISNRQSSTEEFDPLVKDNCGCEIEASILIKEHLDRTMTLYNTLLEFQVARECARRILPIAATSKIYMKGSVRSWIHYLDLREGDGTQAEHVEVARAARVIFEQEFPIITKAIKELR